MTPSRQAVAPATITAPHVQFTADVNGFVLMRMMRRGGADRLETAYEFAWSEVDRMVFDTAGFDPIISLYVVPAAGYRKHLIDSAQLSAKEWSDLARLVARASRGRVTLDLAARGRPRPAPDI